MRVERLDAVDTAITQLLQLCVWANACGKDPWLERMNLHPRACANGDGSPTYIHRPAHISCAISSIITNGNKLSLS